MFVVVSYDLPAQIITRTLYDVYVVHSIPSMGKRSVCSPKCPHLSNGPLTILANRYQRQFARAYSDQRVKHTTLF
jgi:hypothetical protein